MIGDQSVQRRCGLILNHNSRRMPVSVSRQCRHLVRRKLAYRQRTPQPPGADINAPAQGDIAAVTDDSESFCAICAR
jgi:hypothetical protein